MKKSDKKALLIIILIIAAVVVIIILGRLYSAKKAFHYEDHLDDAVITVDGTAVTLREFGYYIFDMEAYIQDQALLYDKDNPTQWWNTHFSAGADSTFVCDYAKESAVNICVSRQIYYLEAVKEGLSLDPDEEERAMEEARETDGKMNSYQRTATGLNLAVISDIKKREALASKYAIDLAKNTDFKVFKGDPAELVNWDGDYYKQIVLPSHSVEINSDILDKLTFGKITVNYEEK